MFFSLLYLREKQETEGNLSKLTYSLWEQLVRLYESCVRFVSFERRMVENLKYVAMDHGLYSLNVAVENPRSRLAQPAQLMISNLVFPKRINT